MTLLATTPNRLVINNEVPARDLEEFIALGKKEGKMTFASSGSGTSIHVSGELFKTMTGIDMTHIPYKGRATAIPDLLGGRVTVKRTSRKFQPASQTLRQLTQRDSYARHI